MPALALLLLSAAAACLAAATAAALAGLLASRGDRRVLVQGLSGTGLALLACFLAREGLSQGRLPSASTADVLAWIALGSVAAHLGCIAALGIRALAPFLLPVAAACALAAPLAGDRPWASVGPVPAPWKGLHGAAALAGMVAFALAFAAGSLYLLQAHRLKAGPVRPARLPSLEALDRLNLWALLLALPCWTVSLLAGVLSAQAAWGPAWASTPLVLFSAAAWCILAAVTGVRLTAAARGRKIAMLSIGGFALAVAALLGGHL